MTSVIAAKSSTRETGRISPEYDNEKQQHADIAAKSVLEVPLSSAIETKKPVLGIFSSRGGHRGGHRGGRF